MVTTDYRKDDNWRHTWLRHAYLQRCVRRVVTRVGYIASLASATARPCKASFARRRTHRVLQSAFAGELVKRRKLYAGELRSVLSLNHSLRKSADYWRHLVIGTRAARTLERTRRLVPAIIAGARQDSVKQTQEPILPEPVQRAVSELTSLIARHFPAASLEVTHGVDDAEDTFIIATVDIDDVLKVVLERMLTLQLDERVPVYVVPVHTPRRIAETRGARLSQENASHSRTGPCILNSDSDTASAGSAFTV